MHVFEHMHPFASNAYGCNGGIGGRRGGGGGVVCKRLALASAGVVSLGVASTVVPIGGAVDDEGGGAGSRGDVATDNPHNSANAAASTTKVPRRNRADVIQNLPDSLQGAAVEGRVASQVLLQKVAGTRNSGPISQTNRVVLGTSSHSSSGPCSPPHRYCAIAYFLIFFALLPIAYSIASCIQIAYCVLANPLSPVLLIAHCVCIMRTAYCVLRTAYCVLRKDDRSA
jgi:hypothetical protein